MKKVKKNIFLCHKIYNTIAYNLWYCIFIKPFECNISLIKQKFKKYSVKANI